MAAGSSAVSGLAGLDLDPGTHGRAGDEDGAAHDLEPLALAEHVLGAAQADALGAVAAGPRGLLGLVGVGPDPRRRTSSAQPRTVLRSSCSS